MDSLKNKLTDLIPYPFELCDYTNQDKAKYHFEFLASLTDSELVNFLKRKIKVSSDSPLLPVDSAYLNRILKFQESNRRND
jgi:hypothetical protein